MLVLVTQPALGKGPLGEITGAEALNELCACLASHFCPTCPEKNISQVATDPR